MSIVSNIIKELRLQEAKHQSRLISDKEFEEYLLEVIEYMAELSELNIKPLSMDYIKDYCWGLIEFTT